MFEIEFVEIYDFLEGFKVRIWGHVDQGHVVFPNEIFSGNVGRRGHDHKKTGGFVPPQRS